METGKRYLLHQMFSRPGAYALTGELFPLGGGVPSVEELQSKYAFAYYSTMTKAITDVNNGTTANADGAKDTAVAGVYTDENGGKNVVLLKDYTEAARVKPSVDMTINLGGHILSADDAVCIQPSAGNLTIDGRLKGSTVFQDRATTMSVCIQASSSEHTESLNVIGGTYRAKGQTKKVNCFNLLTQSCVYTLSNCEIFADGVDLLTTAVFASGDATVNSCRIEVTCTNSLAYGIYTKSTADLTVNNCLIRAYSNYHYGTDGTMGENNGSMHSIGVRSFGTLIMNNCHVFGTGEGVHSNGSMHINGGTYESYGHGGLYFAATDAVSSARNVITRDCDMPDGYTATVGKNGAGMYISGTNASNQSVYMDNCEIIGERENQTIAISSSYGAQNNKLYISNSSIFNRNGGIGRIRIDDDTHRVYIGRGNNFTAENTSLPSAVVVTDKVYTLDEMKSDIKNLFVLFPEYTKSDVSLTQLADGGYMLNGTATSDANFIVNGLLNAGTYTLSCFSEGVLPNDASAKVQVYNPSPSVWGVIENDDPEDTVMTFDVAQDCEVQFRIRISAGHTYDHVTLYPLLVEGEFTSETMPEFVPYEGKEGVIV